MSSCTQCEGCKRIIGKEIGRIVFHAALPGYDASEQKDLCEDCVREDKAAESLKIILNEALSELVYPAPQED